MNYTGYSRKKNKTLKIIALIDALILIGIYALGLTLGSDSEGRVAISDAIEENVRLKQELVQKDNRINELSARIEELENAEKSEATPMIQDEEEEELRQGSPRE